MALQQRIEQAEILREHGDTAGALSMLTAIISEASEAQDYQSLASALGHCIVCFKHLFQNGGGEDHLRGMEQDIEQGFGLPIPEAGKAVFYLRLGDVQMLRGNLPAAEAAYSKAYEVVSKGDHTEAEYLGHLAEAKAFNGKCAESIELLNQALAYMKTCPNVRPFHRVVIVSGLKARMIRAALKCGRYELAISSFVYGYAQAWWLKVNYRMPQRLNQYHSAIFRRQGERE
jgi:tetratricopeptide (TPR) repeat protein